MECSIHIKLFLVFINKPLSFQRQLKHNSIHMYIVFITTFIRSDTMAVITFYQFPHAHFSHYVLSICISCTRASIKIDVKRIIQQKLRCDGITTSLC